MNIDDDSNRWLPQQAMFGSDTPKSSYVFCKKIGTGDSWCLVNDECKDGDDDDDDGGGFFCCEGR